MIIKQLIRLTEGKLKNNTSLSLNLSLTAHTLSVSSISNRSMTSKRFHHHCQEPNDINIQTNAIKTAKRKEYSVLTWMIRDGTVLLEDRKFLGAIIPLFKMLN